MLNPFRNIAPALRAVTFPRSGFGLHAMLSSAGYEVRHDDAYDWHGLRRGDAQFALLQHTISGEGAMTFEGTSYVVQPGQTMLLWFPHDNRYWLPPGGQWEFFFVCVHGSEVMRAWRTAVEQQGPLVRFNEAEPVLATATDICKRVLSREVATPWQASSMAYQLTMQLMDVAMRQAAPGRSGGRSPAIQRAIDHARQAYDRDITVDDLASAAGLSRYHFTRLFSASEGVSPGAFLAGQRLREAVRLLQTSELSVKEIAAACGFADANYFAKAFRKAYGVSPTAFRTSGMYGR